VRALQGKLRIGTAQQTVLVALAHAMSEIQLQLKEGSVMESVRKVVCADANRQKEKGEEESDSTDDQQNDVNEGCETG
jgi:Arc/MetJ family transcription regulator